MHALSFDMPSSKRKMSRLAVACQIKRRDAEPLMTVVSGLLPFSDGGFFSVVVRDGCRVLVDYRLRSDFPLPVLL